MSRLHGDRLGLPGVIRLPNPTQYAPAIVWVNQTLTAIYAINLRMNGRLEVWGSFTVSVSGANGILTIPLPAATRFMRLVVPLRSSLAGCAIPPATVST